MDFEQFKSDMHEKLIKVNGMVVTFPNKEKYPLEMPPIETQYRNTIDLVITILEEYEKRKNSI